MKRGNKMKNCIGIDVGTGNIVVAKTDGKDIITESMRNMFYPLEEDTLKTSLFSPDKSDYIELKNSDGKTEKVVLVGQDAYDLCNAVNTEVYRPMKKGVISSSEIDNLEVIALMFEKLIGGKVDDGYCVYSVPAQPIDVETGSVLWHEKVFEKIFKNLGYKTKAMNEGMAVVFSELAKENFTGIGISFGAGLTNVALAFNGIPIVTFSVGRGGDWIDDRVAENQGIKPNKVTKVKEKEDFDLMNPSNSGKKQEQRIRENLSVYYENLINYVIKVFIKEFQKKADGVDLDNEITIVVSGGTSKPKGFLELFKQVFDESKDDFPFDVKEIRAASDPLDAVAKGNLIFGIWEQKNSSAPETKNKKEKE